MKHTETMNLTCIPVGKGYYHTVDVYHWDGDIDGDGNIVDYNTLRDDYGDKVHDELNTEEPGEYVIPHDEFPYETRTMEEYVLEEFGAMSEDTPLLVQLWPRRYADVTTDDMWDSYYSAEYGSGDWGCVEFLIYDGIILNNETRQSLQEGYIFPYTVVE